MNTELYCVDCAELRYVAGVLQNWILNNNSKTNDFYKTAVLFF